MKISIDKLELRDLLEITQKNINESVKDEISASYIVADILNFLEIEVK